MKEKEVLVKVENLSKKFCKDLKTSLKYGAKDLYANVKGNKESKLLRPKEFWAVKDISFELSRGECLGLIGHNGAGKSTLLKILNGLINPDDGKVTIKGRVGALIELGVGFSPVLSGRENIYNNGAILGFTRKEIDNKLEHIIEFSELREFIDMPVQNYSSGMKVRLGFAIAAQMEPDVLIIDEVLAVGDLGFVLKCFKTIDTLLPNTAIVFVSHSMPMVSRICNQILLMENGKSQFQGANVGKAIDLYFLRFKQNDTKVIFSDGSIELIEAKLLNPKSIIKKIYQLNWGDTIKLFLKFDIKKPIETPLFRIQIFDKEQRPIAVFESNNKDSNIKIDNNKLEFVLTHKQLQFSKGIYSIDLAVFISNNPLLRINGIISFQIIQEEDHFHPFLLSASYEDY